MGNLCRETTILRRAHYIKITALKDKSEWKHRVSQMVNDLTILSATGGMRSHENWMGHVHPFMRTQVLSCHSPPSIKQVQLAGSGTPLSQEAGSTKMELTFSVSGNKKEALWFSGLNSRQPDLQDLRCWWVCGRVTTAHKPRRAETEGVAAAAKELRIQPALRKLAN